jgi:hypothetical protein
MADKRKVKTHYAPVFHQGGGMFAMESESRPGEFHSTDLMDKTCTCERFTIDPVDKGKPCKHLKALDRLLKAGKLTAFR